MPFYGKNALELGKMVRISKDIIFIKNVQPFNFNLLKYYRKIISTGWKVDQIIAIVVKCIK